MSDYISPPTSTAEAAPTPAAPVASRKAPLLLAPTDCPRFNDCNAAVCPLDPSWRRTVHLSGEKVCYYLLVSGKAGATERFADDAIFQRCQELAPEVGRRFRQIEKAIEKAARTGFKGANLMADSGTDGDSVGTVPG